MKRIIGNFLILILPILILIFVINASVVNKSQPSNVERMTFAVLSDVHGQEKKLEAGIKDLYGIDPDMNMMILNGDTVDQGLEEQYKIIENCITRNKSFLPQNIMYNIGNHEFYNYAKGSNTPSDVKDFIGKYLTFSKESSVYHDAWFKGYHFIALGSESGYTPELGPNQAFVSSEQLKWLEEKLKEEYKQGRPIFVFLHQPLNGSINGIQYNWASVQQDTEIRRILSKYPEAILFTSHIHSSLELGDIFMNKPFLAVHTGSVNNPLIPDGKGGRKSVDSSQGLYVEVYNDRVVIRGRDFKNKKWIEAASYTVMLSK